MARGWESKSVEDQQAEQMASSTQKRLPLTPQKAAEQRHTEGLKLIRKHLLQQIENAGDPRYRQMLQKSLDEINSQLKGL